MISNYHTLAYLASSLHSKLAGVEIESAFSQERDELAITFSALEGALLVSCRQLIHTLYVHPRYVRARVNTADVLKGCWGERVSSVSILPADRVISFKLESRGALQAHLFGPKPNVFLVDADGIVADAFRDAKKEVGRTIPSRAVEPLFDVGKIRERLRLGGSQKVASLVKQTFPTLGSTLTAELLHRAGVSADLPSSHLDGDGTERIGRVLAAIISELETPRFLVYVNIQARRPEVFSLVLLQHLLDKPFKEFDDIHAAIRFFVTQRRAADTSGEERKRVTAKLGQHLAKIRRSIVAIEADVDKGIRAEEYQRRGSLLMNNLPSLSRRKEEVTLSDNGLDVVVPLNTAMTPIQNAQFYFDKAKRARAAERASQQRLHHLRASLAHGETLLHTLESLQSDDEWKRVMKEHANHLDKFDIGAESEKHEKVPFRIFKVDGGFEVWAGKSNLNNDLLTMRYAKPKDLWFHVRGGSGSHVVLRAGTGRGDPSKSAKEQAAAVAAYYSKMRKAKTVPVAMTERRYVRKPRGVPAGTVVIEREKVIFVEPGLPGHEK